MHMGRHVYSRKCILIPMPGRAAAADALGMPIDITAYERMQAPALVRARRAATWARRPKTDSAQHAANALYDGACELLAAAHAMRAAAELDGSTTAIAAALGCIDGTLNELTSAVEAMRRQALHDLSRSALDTGERVAVGETERAFSDFANALSRARHAADSMRRRVGPHVAQLTLR
jgi:hypothetical protein